MDLATENRDYHVAKTGYRLQVPGDFNFAVDVIDRRAAEADGTAVIAVSRDGENIRELPYSHFSEQSSRLATALLSLGVGKGDFGALVIGRIPEWYTVLFACMKIGAISMPGTNLLTAKDIAYRVQASKARFIVVTPEHCAKFEEVRRLCPTVEHCIVVGGSYPGWLSFDDLVRNAPPDFANANAPATKADDMMMAYF